MEHLNKIIKKLQDRRWIICLNDQFADDGTFQKRIESDQEDLIGKGVVVFYPKVLSSGVSVQVMIVKIKALDLYSIESNPAFDQDHAIFPDYKHGWSAIKSFPGPENFDRGFGRPDDWYVIAHKKSQ